MAHILSMQSHVVYGYVGNRAAVFPLQRLGHEVLALNTVQFSNHTGYGEWTGDILSLDHINRIFEGLEKRGALTHLDAVLTGYMGTMELGQTLIHWLQLMQKHHPDLIYCCDPVMGDVGRGIFVKENLPAFFQEIAVHAATMMTPNQFELELLSGIKIHSLQDAKEACQILHQKGVKIVLVTSLILQDTQEDEIGLLLSSKTESYVVYTPRLNMPMPVNGSGDATTAFFLAYYLESRNLRQALEKTTASIFALFQGTLQNQRRELDLIGSQEAWVHPTRHFQAKVL